MNRPVHPERRRGARAAASRSPLHFARGEHRLASGLLLGLLLCACPRPVGPDGFDDHTRPSLASRADYDALAAQAHGRQDVKFIVTAFPQAQGLRFLDSAFYTLHDEWFWFRLMNGERVPGREDLAPFTGGRFETVRAIYDWARGERVLPLDLRWVEGDRLYSPRFYELALTPGSRSFGVGTLLHLAAVTAPEPREERWVMMLEVTDALSADELDVYFRALAQGLPPEIGSQLWWLVRSPVQEALAQRLEREQLPHHDRILRPKDLVVPGAIEVYNPGLAAGRLRFVRENEPIPEDASPADILVLAHVPDFLPSAAALITAVPQTPLAHLNVLARNRGMANAYWGGALDSLELSELANQRTPVLLHAVEPGTLAVKAITEQQLSTYQLLLGHAPVAVRPIDTAALPYTYDLGAIRPEDVDALRPAFGGKAAGFVALLSGGAGATPDTPMALSVRAYAEHLAPIRAKLEQLLTLSEFASSPRARVLALEGVTRYDLRFFSEADRRYRDDFLGRYPPGSAMGDFTRAGGVVGELRARPLEPALLATLTSAIAAQFAPLATSQGLRLRSSSNVEDIEGFNGAGLYESNTGFLDAAAQPTAEDRARTLELALKKTWASYWSFEAFEERRLEQVDHLSGHMGVVVHPRFDDGKEKVNGVFLFTLLPPGLAEAAVMELNVQQGAESVTNPTGAGLPEVDRVWLAAGAAEPTVKRLRGSTLVPPGTALLSDAELTELFGRARAVANAWLARANAGLPPERAGRTLTLDFEFRRVLPGWPALASGELRPERTVLKQARSLEPSLRRLTPEQQALPFPRDVLARAARLTRVRCEHPRFVAEVLEAQTDPLLPPDLGHATVPFTGQVKVTFTQDVPELSRAAGDAVTLGHLQLTTAHPAGAGGTWGLDASSSGAAALSRVELALSGAFALHAGTASYAGSGMSCRSDPLFTSAREYLESLR